MEKQGQGQPPVMGGGTPLPYGTQPYQASQMVVPGTAGPAVGNVQSAGQLVPFAAPPAQVAAQNQLIYQHLHQQQQAHQLQQLQLFWANQLQEIEQTADFKNHSLPLARIKKIMKADEDVRMISAEAPIVFAKACEMFILELTLRSWIHTEENKRRTLQKNDIAAAITRNDIFDFLVDIVPRDELKDEVVTGIPRAGSLPVGGPPEMLPYYYVPTQPVTPVGAQGMMMGKPLMDPAMFGQQPHPYAPQQMWQPPASSQEEQQPTSQQ
ncbi:Nuclear transcription factor Y subunit C-3 [Nymphaea thermarum]|nr:Nuclear transcription factor Y subunit C-3 [Nymphaea thermarum]